MCIAYRGRVFRIPQPDGGEVRLRGFGNQRHAVFETLDGHTVVKDPATGFHHYAALGPGGALLVPTRWRVGEVGETDVDLPLQLRADPAAVRAAVRRREEALPRRSRWEERRRVRRGARSRHERAGDTSPADDAARYETVGDYVGLCLLIQFPDVPGTISREEVERFCNQRGYRGFGNHGSVFDYFHDVSGGRLRYENEVVAYYTATHPRAHYTNPEMEAGPRAQELILEALDDLRRRGHDLRGITADAEGFVYAVNAFYAGDLVNAWNEGLWTHQGSLDEAYDLTTDARAYDYQIANMGDELTLQTFCHESGHLVCDFPDLYDYGEESYGVGDYCLMGYGGADRKNPTRVGAYLKHEAGWSRPPRPLVQGRNGVVRAGTDDLYIHARNGREYFLVENRQAVGRDSELPSSGLAIWHVDETGDNEHDQMTPDRHYECSLEQADGRFSLERLENLGDEGDLFGDQADAFADDTTPDSSWWDGAPSGLSIRSIRGSEGDITFVVP